MACSLRFVRVPLPDLMSSAALSDHCSKPSVIMVVGVNGGGKTTTIGKLSSKFRQQGAGVLLSPGDTFRAAAAEQLAEWAQRSGAKMGPLPKREEPQPGEALGPGPGRVRAAPWLTCWRVPAAVGVQARSPSPPGRMWCSVPRWMLRSRTPRSTLSSATPRAGCTPTCPSWPSYPTARSGSRRCVRTREAPGLSTAAVAHEFLPRCSSALIEAAGGPP